MAANESAINIKTSDAIIEEVIRSREAYPVMHSLHHALGVLEEEVFELKLEVYKRPSQRDKDNLRHEALQVIASAIRLIEEAL